jgi:septum formation protein
MPRLILASASPRRADLLAQIGIVPARIEAAGVDESPQPGETPPRLARRLAEAKARLVAERFPDDLVLGADTVVACGRRVLGKPVDEAAARRCLGLLSGRRHRVHGGVSVAYRGDVRTRLVTTAVRFKRLSADELDAYIQCGEWRDKAGAYAIQGRAGAFVIDVFGSTSNVVGLPLYETAALLRGMGLEAD